MIRIVLVSLLLATTASAHEYEVKVDRWIDADTFEGDLDLGVGVILPKQRFRLMCINAPESRGARKTEAGVLMSEHVKQFLIDTTYVELVERDVFGRWLAFATPAGWTQSLNQYLYEFGAPLYHRLTRAERAECIERLE